MSSPEREVKKTRKSSRKKQENQVANLIVPLNDSDHHQFEAKRLHFKCELSKLNEGLNVNIEPANFFFEKRAEEERNSIDYSIKVTIEDAKAGKVNRKIRVYADGIYDLFHAGHARQLMQAKNLLPNTYLIVGVCNDALTHSKKGSTVMNEMERYESLRHCRYIDEVITDAPWFLTEEFIHKHKIDFIAHDDIPYDTKDTLDIYAPWKSKGMFLATQRTDGISTSDVICRIVRDYDTYVRRNIERGYSAKDLNVGFFKKKQIAIKTNFDMLKERVNKYQAGTKGLLNKWEDKSREFIHNFLHLFDTRKWAKHILPSSKNMQIKLLDLTNSDEENFENEGYSMNSNGKRGGRDLESEPSKKRLRYD